LGEFFDEVGAAHCGNGLYLFHFDIGIGDFKVVEATSALDYESERVILNHLPKIRENRTIISVAHRLNTIKYADIIIFIDNGKITEQGTHQELIDKKGGYAKLYQLQQQT
jgi:ABC-type multidrug transport system fused ATPase/permease subunit